MKIAATGFVSAQAGSVASANALLLRALLEEGCEVEFFSKASFVDPRPAAAGLPGFHFTDVTNRLTDSLRARTARVPAAGFLTRMLDVHRYNRMVVQAVQARHLQSPFDVCLWLGDYARGRISGLPTVSFVQGPPGTDARSILRRYTELRELAGSAAARKWWLLARLRLSPFGLPHFALSDHLIVGSRQSCMTLNREFGVPMDRLSSLPYPMDLREFSPAPAASPSAELRCLWLGHIVPRKRLDVFLDGLALAIRGGLRCAATIAGGVGFIPEYENLIGRFPYPERLRRIPSVPRTDVPDLLRSHDVLVQPSEEEDFGSSVAEAQACGLPVIVGRTNGNADYLSKVDIHLERDDAPTLAAALRRLADPAHRDRAASRQNAENHFQPAAVAGRMRRILKAVSHWEPGKEDNQQGGRYDFMPA